MNIVPHAFNGKAIAQLTEDLVIGDRLIPKGYVNATQMCKANGKRWANYSQNKAANDYIEGVSLDAGIPVSSLVIEILGTPGGQANLQGTWVHIEVALDLAQWISVPFRIWANRVLRAIVTNDYIALTPEAEEAKRKVQQIWQDIRDEGIEVRKTFTDSVKDHYHATHPGVIKVPEYAFSNPSDALNRLLTGHPAKYWRERFNVATNEQLRSLWGHPHLRRIASVEELAQAKVENEGIDPIEAVRLAVAAFHYIVWDEDRLLGKGDRKTYERNHKRRRKVAIPSTSELQ